VSRPKPGFKATLMDHAIALKPGATNKVKISVTRLNGFKAKLTLRATGFPDGVTAAPVEAGEKSGDVTLAFMAATNAPPTNTVIRIAVASDAAERFVKYHLTSSTEDNGVPGGFRALVIPETDQIWLTVLAGPDSSTNAPNLKP
jgi:hypothetical protein